MNHPKPWKAPSQSNNPLMGYIQDADGGFIATQLDPATALEIVAAVNSREKLVEALKGIVEQCNDSEWSENETVLAVKDSAQKALSEGGAQ